MSLDQHLNGVRNALLEEINKSKDIVFKGLLENPLINKLPESVFVNYFLPHFIGQGNNPNWVMEWISIAGTPMAEVAIFKDGTNEHLFNVPSLLYTNNLFMHKKGGDLGDIFNRYDQISANVPMNGLSFLLNALNSKNHELMNNFTMDGANAIWLTILQRYGYVNNAPAVGGPAVAQEADLNDFFEF